MRNVRLQRSAQRGKARAFEAARRHGRPVRAATGNSSNATASLVAAILRTVGAKLEKPRSASGPKPPFSPHLALNVLPTCTLLLAFTAHDKARGERARTVLHTGIDQARVAISPMPNMLIA